MLVSCGTVSTAVLTETYYSHAYMLHMEVLRYDKLKPKLQRNWGEIELRCFFLLEKSDVQLTPRTIRWGKFQSKHNYKCG